MTPTGFLKTASLLGGAVVCSTHSLLPAAWREGQGRSEL